MNTIVSPEHRLAAQKFRAIYATYQGAEDLINIGALAPGSNRRIDKAVSLIERAREFLVQPIGQRTSFPETLRRLQEITSTWDFLMPDEMNQPAEVSK
jgi:flagellum-specific ATP synthase